MYRKILIAIMVIIASFQSTKAQFVVSDPMHTGITSLIKLIQDPSFKKIVDGIEKLKKVTSAVRQFHRGTQIISSISGTVTKLSKLSNVVSMDGHIYASEYKTIAEDITKITKEGTSIIKDMKTATAQTGGVLEMTDADRTKWLEQTFAKVSGFENMVNKFVNMVKIGSTRRVANKYDLAATARLYNTLNTTGQGSYDPITGISITGNGYDTAYSNDSTNALTNYENNQKAQLLKQKMQKCSENMQNYYDELEIVNINTEFFSVMALFSEGYGFKHKSGATFSSNAVSPPVWAQLQIAQDDTQNSSFTFSGGGSNISTDMAEDIDYWFGPGGVKITQEEFDIRTRMKTRELIKPQDAALRVKWKLDECMDVGKINGN